MTAPALVIWCDLCRVRGATTTATVATGPEDGPSWPRWVRDLCPTCRRTATEAWQSIGLVVTSQTSDRVDVFAGPRPRALPGPANI